MSDILIDIGLLIIAFAAGMTLDHEMRNRKDQRRREAETRLSPPSEGL